jgi:hypothetical protein
MLSIDIPQVHIPFTWEARIEMTDSNSSNHPTQSCSEAISILQAGNIAGWRGLPKSCTIADLTQYFPRISPGEGRAGLGRREAYFTRVKAESFDSSIRVWLQDTQVLMLDVEALEKSSELSTLLSELGEPATKLDCYLGTLLFKEAEWVYPERGLTLFVDVNSQRLVHIVMFPATTMASYESEFRLNLRVRRLRNNRH